MSGWCYYHFPGYLFPVPHYPLDEEHFPSIQPKTPQRQLYAIPLVPMANHQKEEGREETWQSRQQDLSPLNLHLHLHSFQKFPESWK